MRQITEFATLNKCDMHCIMMNCFANALLPKDANNRNGMVFRHVLNNIGFPMKGKPIRSNAVLLSMRFWIHRYVASPIERKLVLHVTLCDTFLTINLMLWPGDVYPERCVNIKFLSK